MLRCAVSLDVTALISEVFGCDRYADAQTLSVEPTCHIDGGGCKGVVARIHSDGDAVIDLAEHATTTVASLAGAIASYVIPVVSGVAETVAEVMQVASVSIHVVEKAWNTVWGWFGR